MIERITQRLVLQVRSREPGRQIRQSSSTVPGCEGDGDPAAAYHLSNGIAENSIQIEIEKGYCERLRRDAGATQERLKQEQVYGKVVLRATDGI
jgi:hypothetical protein